MAGGAQPLDAVTNLRQRLHSVQVLARVQWLLLMVAALLVADVTTPVFGHWSRWCATFVTGTPHAAAAANNAFKIDYLLSDGGDASLADAYGNTLLHTACEHSSAAVVQTLLAYRADVGRVNSIGQTPLDVCARHSPGLLRSILSTAGTSQDIAPEVLFSLARFILSRPFVENTEVKEIDALNALSAIRRLPTEYLTRPAVLPNGQAATLLSLTAVSAIRAWITAGTQFRFKDTDTLLRLHTVWWELFHAIAGRMPAPLQSADSWSRAVLDGITSSLLAVNDAGAPPLAVQVCHDRNFARLARPTGTPNATIAELLAVSGWVLQGCAFSADRMLAIAAGSSLPMQLMEEVLNVSKPGSLSHDVQALLLQHALSSKQVHQTLPLVDMELLHARNRTVTTAPGDDAVRNKTVFESRLFEVGFALSKLESSATTGRCHWAMVLSALRALQQAGAQLESQSLLVASVLIGKRTAHVPLDVVLPALLQYGAAHGSLPDVHTVGLDWETAVPSNGHAPAVGFAWIPDRSLGLKAALQSAQTAQVDFSVYVDNHGQPGAIAMFTSASQFCSCGGPNTQCFNGEKTTEANDCKPVASAYSPNYAQFYGAAQSQQFITVCAPASATIVVKSGLKSTSTDAEL